MENGLSGLYDILQRMIGQHRQLLDIVRAERESLLNADLRATQEVTLKKEMLLHSLHETEQDRIERIAELAVELRVQPETLTLRTLIRDVEPRFPVWAQKLQSVLNALNVLIERVQEQNRENKILVENFLKHLNEMKRNVLGEAEPKADVYSQGGTKVGPPPAPRLFEREA
jgi:flagellar biosynthesis/type III secretory pathway chaperone